MGMYIMDFSDLEGFVELTTKVGKVKEPMSWPGKMQFFECTIFN